MSGSPKGNRYGQQGGRWLPDQSAGERPFGAFGGVHQECPAPVPARCGCSTAVVGPNDLGKPCPWCGWGLLVAGTVRCRHCGLLMSAVQAGNGWCPYCGEGTDREVRAS